jgi:hypothetical protein
MAWTKLCGPASTSTRRAARCCASSRCVSPLEGIVVWLFVRGILDLLCFLGKSCADLMFNGHSWCISYGVVAYSPPPGPSHAPGSGLSLKTHTLLKSIIPANCRSFSKKELCGFKKNRPFFTRTLQVFFGLFKMLVS